MVEIEVAKVIGTNFGEKKKVVESSSDGKYNQDFSPKIHGQLLTC